MPDQPTTTAAPDPAEGAVLIRCDCKGCGSRLLCYACDVSHNQWCSGRFGPSPDIPSKRGRSA